MTGVQTCALPIYPALGGAPDLGGSQRDGVALPRVGPAQHLALRGDRPAAFTGADKELFAAFPHTADLIRHIREHSPGLAVGTAAFPEGHAEARSFSSDLKVMRDKFQSSADFGITQLFFDNRSYFDYVERLGELGVTAPEIGRATSELPVTAQSRMPSSA